MSFKCGIVGLPNVGKSSLFNSLSESAKAESANYPFCTIEPNNAKVSVPDHRLTKLQKVENSERIVPAYIDIVDIAGIISGAHKGEGLGNKFLSHIREVDVIIVVLRCFDDPNVIHVNNIVDPVADLETIAIELALADIQSLESRLGKRAEKNFELVVRKLIGRLSDWKVSDWLSDPKSGHDRKIDSVPRLFERIAENEAEEDALSIVKKEMHLLCAKPVLCVCNVTDVDQENHYTAAVRLATGVESVIISAKLEEELSSLNDHDRKEMLQSFGLESSGLEKIISKGYSLLNCLTFFTVGPMEVRAWTIENGSTAQESAGKIHSDIADGFIKAEVIAYDDFIALNGRVEAKNAGKLKIEGRDYITQEGDVMLFKHKG